MGVRACAVCWPYSSRAWPFADAACSRPVWRQAWPSHGRPVQEGWRGGLGFLNPNSSPPLGCCHRLCPYTAASSVLPCLPLSLWCCSAAPRASTFASCRPPLVSSWKMWPLLLRQSRSHRSHRRCDRGGGACGGGGWRTWRAAGFPMNPAEVAKKGQSPVFEGQVWWLKLALPTIAIAVLAFLEEALVVLHVTAAAGVLSKKNWVHNYVYAFHTCSDVVME